MPSRTVSTPGKSGKASGKQPVAKRAAAKPGTPRTRVKKSRTLSPEERRRFIAEAAYFRAEQRGFAEGGELGDWVEAEAEIDALLDAALPVKREPESPPRGAAR